MKRKSIEDFVPVEGQKAIRASGQIFNGHHNANLSTLLTKLIQEAGRWCKSYASDLFIWWGAIAEKMEDGSLSEGSYLFGFHEAGVDNVQSILYHYKSMDHMACFRYRAVWRLDVSFNESSSEFVLYEVQR